MLGSRREDDIETTHTLAKSTPVFVQEREAQGAC